MRSLGQVDIMLYILCSARLQATLHKCHGLNMLELYAIGTEQDIGEYI
jgi:hypothetical protein